MTEEELKQLIADEVIRKLPYPYEDDPVPESIADQILALIREAGWKSPEKCQTCWLHNYETMLPTTSIK